MARGGKRADMSEVIEARGHPGRKSHESRASGREQCRETRLRLLLLSFFVRFPLLPSFRSISFLPPPLRLLRHLLLLLLPLLVHLVHLPLVRHVDTSFLARRSPL